MLKKIILTGFAVFMAVALLNRVGLSAAQDVTATAEVTGSAQDNAEVALFNSLDDAHSVHFYLDGAPIGDEADQGEMTERIEIPAGSHAITVVKIGGTAADALVQPMTMRFEAGKFYVLLAFALGSDNVVKIDRFDLGTAPAKGQIVKPQIALFNHFDTTDAFQETFDDKVKIANVKAGESGIAEMADPFHVNHVTDVQTKENLDNNEADPTQPATTLADNLVALTLMEGKYPGEQGTDYQWYSNYVYIGEVKKVDNGPIHLGDTVKLNIKAGQREDYTLTVDAQTDMDVVVSDQADGEDAYARVFNAAGEQIGYNDDIGGDPYNHGSGIYRLSLDPGTYTVEAGSWVDVEAGAYTLSVSASTPLIEATATEEALDSTQGSASVVVLDDGPEDLIDVYVDGKLLSSREALYLPGDAIQVPAGHHTIAVTKSGSALTDPLAQPITATFNANKLYAIWSTPGQLGQDVALFVLDLGAAPADGQTMPGRAALFNFLRVPITESLVLDGKPVVAGVKPNESGSAAIGVDTYHKMELTHTDTGVAMESNTLSDDDPVSHVHDNVIEVFLHEGAYPGDDGWWFEFVYAGKLTRTASGPIHVGDSISVDLKTGQRADYTLTLDARANVNISLSGKGASENAYLRVFDAGGHLVDQNDNSDNLDASLNALALDPGTYTIEAASFLESEPGAFSLKIEDADEGKAAATTTPAATAASS